MALPRIVSGGGIAINVISIAVVVDIVFVFVFVIRQLNNRIIIFSVTALEVNASASRMLLDRNVKGKILLLNIQFRNKILRVKTNTTATQKIN